MTPSKSTLVLICCAALFSSSEDVVLAADNPPAASGQPEAPKLSAGELDSLVAPIALYPDPLLAQTLAASTYPLEIVQLAQWLEKHKDLKDKALADAVAKQPWDPSVQSMAATPEVVKRLAEDIQWTTDLGNAFLGQQADVMDAVQRMRAKAKDKGTLSSNKQQKVESKVVEQKTIIEVQPADPDVIYVPSYSPTVVYGPPAYPYPPIAYPPYTPGAAFVSFGFGVAMGASFWGGSCCYAGWATHDVDVNVNNHFNQISQNRGTGANRTWQHNPQHRGGAPYGDRATAARYGGGAQARAAGAQARAAGASPSARPAATGDRIGNRQLPSNAGARSGAFSSGDFNGAGARAASARGAGSMRARGGGRRR